MFLIGLMPGFPRQVQKANVCQKSSLARPISQKWSRLAVFRLGNYWHRELITAATTAATTAVRMAIRMQIARSAAVLGGDTSLPFGHRLDNFANKTVRPPARLDDVHAPD